MEPILLSDMKHEIKTGDTLAFTTKKITSITSFFLWMYQKFAKVKYSHVGIAVWLGDRLFIVEAVQPRVSITPISKVDSFYHVPVSTDRTSDDIKVSFLMDYVDTPYSLIDMGLHYLNMSSDKSSIYCSALAAAFYFYIGVLLDKDMGHSPQKLVDSLLYKADLEQATFVVTDRGNI